MGSPGTPGNQPAMINRGGLGLLVSSSRLSSVAAFPPVIVFSFCLGSGFTPFMFLSVFIKIELRCEIMYNNKFMLLPRKSEYQEFIICPAALFGDAFTRCTAP